MPFGFQYWMVLLPEVDSSNFLLFVHNPAGATKLRSYASGRAKVIGQPSAEEVFRATEIGTSRHECEPHKTDDHGFWYHKTQELNRRYLSGGHPVQAVSRTLPAPGLAAAGLAAKGSQRQIQQYVNLQPETLSNAILEQLPPRVRELRARIHWVSPLAADQYQEFRDAEFLARVGLSAHATALAAFWPSGGPSWDALGIISDPAGAMKPGVILLEAKSHIPEIYGNGCQAGDASLPQIEAALAKAKSWCGVSGTADWLGPLYQSANRLAHLCFLLDQVRTPAWLVNLCFTGDPIRPTTREEWQTALESVKAQLGLTRPPRNVVDVFLPALAPARAVN